MQNTEIQQTRTNAKEHQQTTTNGKALDFANAYTLQAELSASLMQIVAVGD